MTPNSTSNRQAELVSAEGYHRRLCEAFDRGENVTVALRLAHERLVRAKALVDDATHRHCTCAYSTECCLCKADKRNGAAAVIIKTARIVCDHDDCRQFHEGDTGESRALVVVKSARAQGWVASDGRQYCPQHIDMADVGAEWWERQARQEQMAHRTLLRKQDPKPMPCGPVCNCPDEFVRLEPRPCCHTTGPNHHPTCTTKETAR